MVFNNNNESLDNMHLKLSNTKLEHVTEFKLLGLNYSKYLH
jgi:hypothetical protein